MTEETALVAFSDQRTLAFYGTLLGLVLLDIILIFWILDPFTRTGSAVFVPEPAPKAVSDARKPSPFEVAGGKPETKKPRKTRQARAASPTLADARLQ